MINKMKYIELVTKYRRDLHKIPEIGFDLYLTHKYIVGVLEELGYEYEVVAKTGIVAYIKGKSPQAIAFRADMDALNVKEETGVDYQSNHRGKMHACGHDGHMAMLLAFSHFLKEVEKQQGLNNSVVLIFQPAEEAPGGAKEIIKAGIFEKYNIMKIFGLHLDPSIDEGIFGLRSGIMLSQNGAFEVTINGKSAHGAMPHYGNDAIIASASLIKSYQTIISRNLNPLKANALTIGTINGGEANNVIARKVTLTGTFRTFDEEDYQLIKQRIKEINQGIETMYNVEIKTNLMDFYKTVINDGELFNLTIKNLNEDEYIIIEPLMASEDFSFYQRKVPGLFTMLGTKNEKLGFTYPLHHACFNFNEEVLVNGVIFYILQAKIHGIINNK